MVGGSRCIFGDSSFTNDEANPPETGDEWISPLRGFEGEEADDSLASQLTSLELLPTFPFSLPFPFRSPAS